MVHVTKSFKARPHSTIKVPEALPSWKVGGWRRVWRAAFGETGDETLARRIATAVTNPPATKTPNPVFVPSDVLPENRDSWTKVVTKTETCLSDPIAARKIAYRVVGQETPNFIPISPDATMTNPPLIVPPLKNYGYRSIKSASAVLDEMPTTDIAAPVQESSPEGHSAFLTHRAGGGVNVAIKSLSVVENTSTAEEDSHIGFVEGYLVSFGSPTDTDLQGEFFTSNTDFCLDWFEERPVLYHHGMDSNTGLKKIGVFKTIKADDLGLWVTAQLDLRDRYARAVYDMVKSSQFGWSSGSVDHLVKIADNGQIKTWPLIEGSITPTPAQPAKTAVRAYKAVLSNDGDVLSKYLEAFESRVENTYYTDQQTIVFGKDDQTFKGVKSTMSQYFTNRSYHLARAVAKAFGLKGVTDSELQAVASAIEPAVQDELSVMADEIGLPVATDEMSVASYRSLRNRRAKDFGQEPAAFADELPAATLAEEIAAEVKSLKRQQAIARAARSIVEGEAATDATHMGIPATQDPLPNLMDTAKRYRRAKDFGQEAAVYSDEFIQPTVASDELSVVADKAYAAGFRRGYRAFEESTVAAEEAIAQKQLDAALASLDDSSVASEDTFEQVKSAFNAGYNSGLSRALRNLETTEAVATEEELAGKFLRGYRADAYIAPVTSPTNYSATPSEADEVPFGGTLTAKQYRRALRNNPEFAAMSGEFDPSMLTEGGLDPAVMGEFDAHLSEPGFMPAVQDEFNPAAMGDQFMTKNFQRPGAQKAVSGYGADDAQKQIAYLQRRLNEYETMEAPGHRGFKSVSVTRDAGDQPGAYGHAFKSYLVSGLAGMMDYEKSVLKGKGSTKGWGSATMAYDSNNLAIKSYSSGSDASAGFLVPEDWVNELNKNIMTKTVMAGECMVRTTTSDRIVQPTRISTDGRRSSLAEVRWPGEEPSSGTQHRATENEYSQTVIPINLMLMSYVATNSLLEDATFNLEQEINEAFSEATSVAYDTLIMAGDGQGKLQGVTTSAFVNGSPSLGTQSVGGYVLSGSPSGIVSADSLRKMLFDLPAVYASRAKWYMNRNTALEISTLKNGNGDYLIDQRSESLQNMGVPDRLFGRPIVINDFAPDIAEDEFPVVFGDFSRGYVIGKRVEFSIRRFDDAAYAENDSVLFMGRARLGGQVILPHAFKLLKIAAS